MLKTNFILTVICENDRQKQMIIIAKKNYLFIKKLEISKSCEENLVIFNSHTSERRETISCLCQEVNNVMSTLQI